MRPVALLRSDETLRPSLNELEHELCYIFFLVQHHVPFFLPDPPEVRTRKPFNSTIERGRGGIRSKPKTVPLLLLVKETSSCRRHEKPGHPQDSGFGRHCRSFADVHLSKGEQVVHPLRTNSDAIGG